MDDLDQIDPEKISHFRRGLTRWRKMHGLRSYPWRETDDLFKILVTEILLRRTRADSVAGVWSDLFATLGSFSDIAQAKREDLIELLEQLGLVNRRIRTLKKIADQLDSDIPKTRDELIKLFGVGSYIAGISIIMTENRKEIVYDTNFRRVYSRYFGLDIMKDLKRDPHIEELSDMVIPENNPKEFVLTLLDFAALTCKPSTPDCINCELNIDCEYVSSLHGDD